MPACYHPSIEGAQHGAKSLAQFLDYAKASGAAGAQPSNYMLQAENLTMKITLMQTEQGKVRDAFNALLKSLEKPGFHLERDAQGQNFVYVADPPKADVKPPEKK